MNKSGSFTGILTILLIIMIGCTSGSNSPAGPPIHDTIPDELTANTHGSDSSSRIPLGVYRFRIDLNTREVKVIPARQILQHFNVYQYMQPPKCDDCFHVKVTEIDRINHIAYLSVQLTNPFPLLTGYDPRVIIDPKVSGYWLENPPAGFADGYSELFNTINGTRNSFVAFAKEETDRSVPGGGMVSGDVKLHWPNPGSLSTNDFLVIVDSSFPGNCLEPYEISNFNMPVHEFLQNEVDIPVQCDVKDWQDDISSVEVLIQEQGTDTTVLSTILPLGAGDTYSGTFDLDFQVDPGEYDLWIKAISTGDPATAMWQFQTLTVIDINNQKPVALATSSTDTESECIEIAFSDNGSFDPDGGSIMKYEWDFENDGTYDAEGANVNHTYPSNGVYSANLKVTDDEGSTATLSEPIEMTILPSEPIAAGEADLTETNPGISINFDGSNSTPEPCGQFEINSWEWDFDNDGTFTGSGETTSHSYTETGEYDVQLRVTDTGGKQDILDTPIHISITDVIIPPGNVTGFSASDGLGTLANKTVRLTWMPVPSTNFYEIERRDWEYAGDLENGSWQWTPVTTLDFPATAFNDPGARYCGTDNPIEYRIRALNDGGTSPDWATDTGYPKPREVWVSFWTYAEDQNGTNAYETWNRASDDQGICNQFWNRYGLNMKLENSPGQLHYFTNPAWLNLSGSEIIPLHNASGKANNPEAISVYYVNSVGGGSQGAFTISICEHNQNNTQNVFIVIYGPPVWDGDSSLPHEVGHAVARLYDEYEVDLNHDANIDSGETCDASLQNDPCFGHSWLMFCDDAGTYPQWPNINPPNNLMWYNFNFAINNYNITELQGLWFDEWMSAHEGNYPMP
ncbi:MAG TPA: PKD domain-containing protein [bacterium]|jgi:PKD repeat protein